GIRTAALRRRGWSLGGAPPLRRRGGRTAALRRHHDAGTRGRDQESRTKPFKGHHNPPPVEFTDRPGLHQLVEHSLIVAHEKRAIGIVLQPQRSRPWHARRPASIPRDMDDAPYGP